MKKWIVMYGQRRLLRRAGSPGPSRLTQGFEQLEDAKAFVAQCKVDGMYAVMQPTPAMKAILDLA